MKTGTEIFTVKCRITLPDPKRRRELYKISKESIKNLPKHNFKIEYEHKGDKYYCYFRIIFNSKKFDEKWEHNCEVIIEKNQKEVRSYERLFYAELARTYLMHLALIFNLSVPGSFEIYEEKLYNENRYKVQINFCSTMWMYYTDQFLKINWPRVEIIPYEKTYEWFCKLKIGLRQLASNKIEYALFSLLNYSTGEVSPTNILWLAQCLEALYDSPKDPVINKLKERIFMNLGKPTSYKKIVNKQINDFYNLRSRIIHGDFKISVPLASEVFDREVDDIRNEFIDIEQFIMSIIISTIQQYIINRSNKILFAEKMEFLEM